MAEIQVLGPYPLAGSWIESRGIGTQTGTLVWEVGIHVVA